MDWTDIEDIAEGLEEAYPKQELLQLRFTDLHRMVMDLPGFAGQADRCNERILEAIQASWITLRQENSNE